MHRWNPNYSTVPVMGSGVAESSLTAIATTDYVQNFVYEDNVLKRIVTGNGYVENNRYVYHIKDHLGSVRGLSYQSARSQSLNYYPFGMLYGLSTAASKQPYLYTGKELDRMHGLEQYDSQARFYDPAFGRFTTMDPLAEKYYSWSPYNYCGNNPLNRIDPDGRDWCQNNETNYLHGITKMSSRRDIHILVVKVPYQESLNP